MPSAPVRILIVAALCLLGLIGLVVREGMAREAGTEVLLAMEAVDPRSLLSGHYVIVDLRERLAPGEPCPPAPDEQTDLWLTLAPSAGEQAAVYRLTGAALGKPAVPTVAGALLVRGRFTCVAGEAEPEERPGWIALDLGIDRFHIAQSEAERIERILREQRPGEDARVFAVVSIGRDGRARLKGLMVDGERFELEWL